MIKCFKRWKQKPMLDDLNRLSYFVTVSSVKLLGFCHCYFLSFEFAFRLGSRWWWVLRLCSGPWACRTACRTISGFVFRFSDLNDWGNCPHPLQGGFLRPPAPQEERSLTKNGITATGLKIPTSVPALRQAARIMTQVHGKVHIHHFGL